MSIPVVDIGLDNGEHNPEQNWNGIAKAIDDALSGIGFVYLKGHGIPEESLKNVFEESRKFFELDAAEKSECTSSDDKRRMFGYDELNEKLKIGNKHRESFNTPAYPFDGILEKVHPSAQRLVSALFTLTADAEPLVHRLLRVFAHSLQLDDLDYFRKRCVGLRDGNVSNLTRLKTIFYPYLPGMQAGMERCSTHADFGLLTLLWQDAGGGLEILTDGKWIPAKPIPGTILVNTGNLLTYWSGGRYPATIHRVGISEFEIENQMDRQSLAYFVIPDDNTPICPLLSHQPNYSGEIPAAGKTMSVEEYMRQQLDSVYTQKIS